MKWNGGRNKINWRLEVGIIKIGSSSIHSRVSDRLNAVIRQIGGRNKIVIVDKR